MDSFSLAHFTVVDVGPPDLITMAAQAGYRSVGIRLISPVPGGPEYPLEPESSAMKETLRRMADLDVGVLDIEVVVLESDTDVRRYAPAFEAGAALGAKRVTVNVVDPDRARTIDRYSALCDMAKPLQLCVDLEFMIWRQVATLQDAIDVVTKANRSNGAIMIDALHLFRSGGSVADVRALDPKLLGSVQLCDAPLEPPPREGIVDEARGRRLPPGQGELPLLDLLAALPTEIPLAVEVPMYRILPDASALERARIVHDATAALLRSSSRAR